MFKKNKTWMKNGKLPPLKFIFYSFVQFSKLQVFGDLGIKLFSNYNKKLVVDGRNAYEPYRKQVSKTELN
jgi:hypothetical protein